MSEQLQLRRNTATSIASFTGAQGEVVIDTTNNRIVVQDASTPGGWPAAKLSEVVPNATPSTAAVGANGSSIQFASLEFQQSGLSGATVTCSMQIPANCIFLGISARVTTAITGCTTFSISATVNGNSYSSTGLNPAAGSTSFGVNNPLANYSAANITLTAVGGATSFSAGAVRLSIHYMLLTAPTS